MSFRDLIDHVTGLFGDSPPNITQKDILDEDIRKTYPQYAGIPDEALAAAAATKDPTHYGFLGQYAPDSPVEPARVPKTMRTERFYQRYPDEAKNEATASLASIRQQFPSYTKVPDEQLAAAAEKNDPAQYQGLVAKLKAPDLEKARKQMYERTLAVSEEVLGQLKTAIGNTTGAIPVEKFREGFNRIVSPKIEQAKVAIINDFAPSEESIVEMTQKTGKIPYADIAYRTALQTVVSQVPSTLEGLSTAVLAPPIIKGAAALERFGAGALAGKYPVLSGILEKIYGNLKGVRLNPDVMPEGFKPPPTQGAPAPATEFSFMTPDQKALPAGETAPALTGRAPTPGIAGKRPAVPQLKGGVEGAGFRMTSSPDVAAFMEHLGYSPKRGDVITRAGYPPPESLPVKRGTLPLSLEQAAIENRAATLVETKHPDLIRQYQEKFGKTLDVDKARELFPDYAASPEARSLNAGAVHEPASTLIRAIYKQELAKPVQGNADTVLFTAGGGGVGKSESLKAVGPLFTERAGIIYDGTLAHPDSSIQKIDQALASGRKAEIVSVFRDPQGSLEHVLHRAMRDGRTVPLKEWVKAHNEAPKTMRLLVQKYKANPDVSFHFIDNSLGKGNARMTGIEVLDKSVYTDYGEAQRYVYEQRRQGKISEAVYRGTTGEPSGLGVEGRAGDGGLAQQPAGRVAPPEIPPPKPIIPEVGKSTIRPAEPAFARRGETGSVTLGSESAPSSAGPATNEVQDRIGAYSDNTPLAKRAENAVHQLYQDTLDRFHSISRYTQMATEGFTKPILPGENPVLLARSYLGVSGKADTFLRQKTFRNTPEGNIKFTGQGLDEVMRPMRGALPDLDNYLVARRTLDLAGRDIQTGVPPETAAKAVAELEAKYPQIKDVAAGIQGWNDSLLQYLVDSGRIGEQNYEAIKAANQFYAPMQRVMDEAQNPEFTTKNKNVFDRIINPIKKIKGSKRQIISPIESMVRNTFTIMDAADRNAVARAIVNLRQMSPEVAELIAPVENVSRGTITVYDNGKPKHYEVPPDLLKTMQGLHEEGMGMLAKILSYPASILRAGATLTPEFAARNPIRDQWNAMINAKFGFIPGWDFQRGLFSLLKADESYARWQASGGAQSFMVSLDKTVNDVRYRPPVGYGAKFEQYAKNPLRMLQDLSELSEKPTRLGVFKKAQAAGASDIEAGFEARESTTDFGRRGARTRSINAIYAFFNARLQGAEKTARAFRERPLRSSLAAAPLILASIYNYLTYKDDKDFQELPKWRRLLFWNFRAGHHWVSIPKGDVGVIFGGTAEKILEFIDQHDPSKLSQFAGDLFDQISPMDVKGGGYIPTGIKPIVENVANYNFFRQRPIVPQGKQGLLPEHQFTNYDTEITKAVGRALHVSPAKVTNLISGLTGGLGRYALEGLDAAGIRAGVFPKRPEQPKQPADYPLLRGFVARNPRGFGSNSANEFYQNLNEVMQARESIKKVPAEGRRIFYAHPEVVAYRGFEKTAKALSLLREKRNQIMQSNWPVERKRQYGERIDETVTDMTRRINQQYEKLKKK